MGVDLLTDTSAPPALDGRRIVQIRQLLMQIQADRHDGGTMCSFMDSNFVKEVNNGLKSKLFFRCKVCLVETVLDLDMSEANVMDVNMGAVTGTLAGGGGYSSLHELSAGLNMPCMAPGTYMKREKEVGDAVLEATMQDMLEKGREERRLAIEAGDLCADGTPFITVVADGMWGKRSYGNKYDAQSGTAFIVGYRTKKVLFFGVRNKFCLVHALAARRGQEPRDHACSKNHEGSSTSMEASIIVDGFSSSEEMHNLRYLHLIGDGDSSVHNRLLETMPYGPGQLVQKIECKNHLLRNFRKNLLDLSNNSKLKVPEGMTRRDIVVLRRKLRQNVLRLSKDIATACKRRANMSGNFLDRAKELRKDILNAPAHVFGDHALCATYFCSKQNTEQAGTDDQPPEENVVTELKKAELWGSIMEPVNRLANHASSLLHNVNNNICEITNSVVVKYIRSKRIFFSAYNSFKVKCAAGALSMNTSGQLHRHVVKRLQHGKSPGFYTKRFGLWKTKRLRSARRGRTQRRLNFEQPRKRPSAGPDKDYGKVNEQDEDDADEPQPLPLDSAPSASGQQHISNLTEEDIRQQEEKQQQILRELEQSVVRRSEIAALPQNSPEWMHERRLRLTSSHFGGVCRRRPYTSCRSAVHSILYCDKQTAAMRHGHAAELVAKDNLLHIYDVNFQSCGLFVDENQPFLAASPDGLIGLDKVLEIKSPLQAADYTSVEEAIAAKVIDYLEVQNGEVHLKKQSHYYYQVQGQLHITKRRECLFMVHTRGWDAFITVERDDHFWQRNMHNQLEIFYMECLLPEIAGRHYRRAKNNVNAILDPPRIIQAMKEKSEADRQKEERSTKRKLASSRKEADGPTNKTTNKGRRTNTN